jgi:hypothetical protein
MGIMGGNSGGGGRGGRSGGGAAEDVQQPGEVFRAANQFNAETASKAEIKAILREQRTLSDKIRIGGPFGKATEADRARDKELYFATKNINKNPNFKKAYDEYLRENRF